MKRYIPIWAALLMSFSAQAQVSDEEINVVIFAPKAEQGGVDERLPACNDKEMINAVTAHIQEYQEGNPSNSIVGRRKQKLIVKNLRDFEDVSIADFDRKSNYSVAKELVMAKVNYHLEEKDMRLCSNTGSDIYLLMYPEGSGARVQIINFVPVTGDSNDFSVYFEKPKEQSVSTASEAQENDVSAQNEVKAEEQNETSEVVATEDVSEKKAETEIKAEPAQAQPEPQSQAQQ